MWEEKEEEGVDGSVEAPNTTPEPEEVLQEEKTQENLGKST